MTATLVWIDPNEGFSAYRTVGFCEVCPFAGVAQQLPGDRHTLLVQLDDPWIDVRRAGHRGVQPGWISPPAGTSDRPVQSRVSSRGPGVMAPVWPG